MNSTRLNYFFFFHPDAVDLFDHRYNCLPDAPPLPVQRRFFLNAVEIRALHNTSPGGHSGRRIFLSRPSIR